MPAWTPALPSPRFLRPDHVADTAEVAAVRGSMRLALGMLVALPTTMAFLGLSVAVVLGRSVTALGARAARGPSRR